MGAHAHWVLCFAGLHVPMAVVHLHVMKPQHKWIGCNHPVLEHTWKDGKHTSFNMEPAAVPNPANLQNCYHEL